MILGIVYFFLPLVATFLFSLRAKRGVLTFLSYQQLFNDNDFIKGFSYSVLWGVLTIIVGILIFVPTAFWVRLKVPRFRTAVEFVTLLPFVIPAIVNFQPPAVSDREQPGLAGCRLRRALNALYVPLH